jgi:protein O-mannosyl-transferase
MHLAHELTVTPAPSSAKSRDWVWGLLLLAATFLAYQPAWNGLPVWDDAAHMTKPALRSAAGLVSIWTQLGATQQYYPLMHTVFWLEYHLWGESTLGHHLLSILLHSSSALLLVAILRRLRIPGAWLAGALFALHPVMVESVAWISELKNTLSGVFFLAAALTYFQFDDKRDAKHYVIAFLFFVFGLLTKSVIATLPVAVLVVLWWARGAVLWKRDVVPLLPFLVVGILSGLFTAWVERRFIGAEGNDFNFSLLERCLIAGRALGFYLYKLLWPANLVFVYPRWHIDSTVAWQYLFPVGFLLLALVFWVLRRRARAPLAALLYFSATLFPALGFFNVYPFLYSFVADHFQYLASLGPIVAVAAAIARGTTQLRHRQQPLLRLVLSGLLLSVLFVLSRNQSRMYGSAETLFRTTIGKNNDCWMAHTHLGLLLMDAGRYTEAMSHLHTALELSPNQADAYNNLGLLNMAMDRPQEAMVHLQKALALNPKQADAHNNLGALLARHGRPDEAMVHLRRALELHPEHAEVHYNLGDLLAGMGRTDAAIVHYQKALELHPGYAEAHNNLGLVYARMERPDQAIVHFKKALALNPRQANAHNNLGVMLAQTGRIDEAIIHYRRALEIDPAVADHLENLVFALVKKKQWTDAMLILQDALASAKLAGDEARARTIGELHEAVNAAKAGYPTQAR